MRFSVRTFAEYVQEGIYAYLPDKYQGAACYVTEILKNNDIYGIALKFDMPGGHLSCSIPIESYFLEHGYRKDNGRIMEELSMQIQEVFAIEKLVKENPGENFQRIKPQLRISLVNTGRNRRRLSAMPHREMEDLSMVCEVRFPDSAGNGKIDVTNEILEGWGIGEEELFDTALKSMQESKDYVMERISERASSGFFGCAYPPENLLYTPADVELDPPEVFYLLTNTRNFYGASAVLCPEVMEKVSILLPEGFYILPSSVHEVLLVSKEAYEDVKGLGQIVRDVNRTAVAAEDFLSNHIYEYDRENGRICQIQDSKEKKRGMER